MSDWIPCSERLPENNCEEELILCISGKQRNVTFDRAVVCYNCGYENDKFYLDGRYLEPGVTVHAWMPLPEPYKEES